MELNLQFFECEHNEDLENYKADVRASGGDILNSGVDYEAEIGWIKVKVDCNIVFFDKLKETDAYDFMT